MGNLLREYEKEDSDRGRTIRDHLANGTFPPEPIVIGLLKDWMAKHSDGWIIDGFPRTVEQARQAEAFFRPEAVVYLSLPDEDAKRRISYRRVCAKCGTNYNIITQPPKNTEGKCDVCGGELVRRVDDTPERVVARLKLFHETTDPVRDFFKKKGLLYEIDARPGIKEVAHEIEVRLAEAQRGAKRSRRNWRWLFAAIFVLLSVAVAFTATGYFLSY